jgi:hypothetical protein
MLFETVGKKGQEVVRRGDSGGMRPKKARFAHSEPLFDVQRTLIGGRGEMATSRRSFPSNSEWEPAVARVTVA